VIIWLIKIDESLIFWPVYLLLKVSLISVVNILFTLWLCIITDKIQEEGKYVSYYKMSRYLILKCATKTKLTFNMGFTSNWDKTSPIWVKRVQKLTYQLYKRKTWIINPEYILQTSLCTSGKNVQVYIQGFNMCSNVFITALFD
jgi:hypothetical protein